MDASITRRGQPCWYKLNGIDMDAINDGWLLISALYFLLKKHLDKDACYTEMVDLFHRVSFQTEMGQMLDLMSQSKYTKVTDIIKTFNMKRYKAIVKYKTAYYSFYLPVAAGMLLCGVNQPETLSVAEKITCELGEKFQIEDDYLDCFGDPKHIGKIGTDIKDHKCSWLLAQALQICTPEQHKLIMENVGVEGDEHEKVIKDMYRAMNMDKRYQEQETTSNERIKQMIANSPADTPRETLTQLLHKIHGRTK